MKSLKNYEENTGKILYGVSYNSNIKPFEGYLTQYLEVRNERFKNVVFKYDVEVFYLVSVNDGSRIKANSKGFKLFKTEDDAIEFWNNSIYKHVEDKKLEIKNILGKLL